MRDTKDLFKTIMKWLLVQYQRERNAQNLQMKTLIIPNVNFKL